MDAAKAPPTLRNKSILGLLRFEPEISQQKGSDTMFKNQISQKFKLIVEGLGISLYSNRLR